jgi:hypothetical protein
MVRGISCALESTMKKGKPAIPIGTLLALANSIHASTQITHGKQNQIIQMYPCRLPAHDTVIASRPNGGGGGGAWVKVEVLSEAEKVR